MSVLITTPNLQSEPDDFGAGDPAALVLHLVSTVPEGETASITYTIETGGYTFQSGGGRLAVNQFVAGSGTTVSRTPYSLNGPDGGVNLSVSVTPASPPSTGATRVTVAGAGLAAATSVRSRRRASRPRPAAKAARRVARPRKAATAKASPKTRTGAKARAPQKRTAKPIALKKTAGLTRTAAAKRRPGKGARKK